MTGRESYAPGPAQGARIQKDRIQEEERWTLVLVRQLRHAPGGQFVEFALAHRRKPRVGETAEDQVDLADAAVPGAEQKPPPPRVQALARSCRHNVSKRQKPGRSRVPVI